MAGVDDIGHIRQGLLLKDRRSSRLLGINALAAFLFIVGREQGTLLGIENLRREVDRYGD
jgi:hypothetical protein